MKAYERHYCKDCTWLDGTWCKKRGKSFSEATVNNTKTNCTHWVEKESEPPQRQRPSGTRSAKGRGEVDASCKGCVHLGRMGWGKHHPCCDYILNTKKPRPCPAGEECTEYTPMTKKRRKRPFEQA